MRIFVGVVITVWVIAISNMCTAFVDGGMVCGRGGTRVEVITAERSMLVSREDVPEIK